MYAGTKVNWHEVLQPDSVAAATNESLPLFLCAFSADKGSEDITDFTYKDFVTMYGSNADFFKYGQPLIQAFKILNAGGRVLGKRLVAADAKLANLIITAEVTSVTENKTDADGNQLYIADDGSETTVVTDTPATSTYAKIKYAASTATNASSFADVESAAEALKTASVFPLFAIADNGRGVSVKSVRISPDYEVSKTLPTMYYKIQDIESLATVESARFTVNPDAINSVNGVRKNMALTLHTTAQFLTTAVKSGVDAFVAKLAEITGYTTEELYALDLLFGRTVKGIAISAIKVDETGLDITAEYGLALQSGNNGSFGDAPFVDGTPKDEWTAAAVEFFGGEYSPEIYDLDQHKIDFCVDAAYPDAVKAKIVELANFREDFFYFRDLGLDIHTLGDIQNKIEDNAWVKSPFVGDYASCYDIIDPQSRKQITVTMLHGLAPLLVSHYAGNVAAPIAGEFNGFVISEAIDGTLSFVPRITPRMNQKETLDDLRVNFVNYSSDGRLTVQSTYTSQDHYGPLTYSSNVIVTQMCIKAIRRYCPKIRFMLMDPETVDFEKYKSLIVDNVINTYTKYFNSIELRYVADEEMTNAKIFSASLYCYYRNFAQGEIFDVFSVEGTPTSNPV